MSLLELGGRGQKLTLCCFLPVQHRGGDELWVRPKEQLCLQLQ